MTLEKVLRETEKNDLHLLAVDAKTGYLLVIRNVFTGDWIRLSFWQRLKLLFTHLD